ncbi:HORMA-1 domain-containing protein [Tenacibaculum xiamenense]|uniref:HORMA-1 domain-containing protein n=1 Tax=Tenacibaculum xiamenense TaxID=1261553 RepID=UPI00389470AF
MSYNIRTNTGTYTVVDIRRTFENCIADIRMIARRTRKWDPPYVDSLSKDILKLAENKYLSCVTIILKRKNTGYQIRAAKFRVNENGTTSEGDRAGKNYDWPSDEDTYLTVILSYTELWHSLTQKERDNFSKDFEFTWTKTSEDISFNHLTSDEAQLYGSKNYEVQKTNFK